MDDYLKDVWRLSATVKRGGVVLYPTDTIWGIGCDARNPEAVDRIYRIKQRPSHLTLIVLCQSLKQMGQFVGEVPDFVEALVHSVERPTTVVLSNVKGFAPGVIAADGSVGLRIPADPFCKALLKECDCPLVSTSANISGREFGGSFSDIHPEIIAQVDDIAYWRRSEKITAQPSRVVKVGPNGEITLLRG